MVAHTAHERNTCDDDDRTHAIHVNRPTHVMGSGKGESESEAWVASCGSREGARKIALNGAASATTTDERTSAAWPVERRCIAASSHGWASAPSHSPATRKALLSFSAHFWCSVIAEWPDAMNKLCAIVSFYSQW